MENTLLLRTHSIMSLLLLLYVTGTFIYVNGLKEKTEVTKWFRIFYLCQMLWQFTDMVRYTLHPSLIGSLFYKIVAAFGTMPFFGFVEIAYVHFLYLFLGNPFQRERKVFLFCVYILLVITCALVFWNEFYNQSNLFILNIVAFSYGLFFNVWALVLCFRKASFFRKNNQPLAAQGNNYMAWVNIAFITPSICVILFGFYSLLGSWSFFLLVWLGNLAEIVVYINFGAVPINFQTKLMGFSFVIVMTVLMMVTLVFYPLLPPTEVIISTSQQDGLIKLVSIIVFTVLVLIFVLPRILRYTLTDPLQRLLDGVQKVNAGDLSSKVIVGQPDEIGNLTANFNLMTESLQKSNEELVKYATTLEQKVKERTTQLQQSLDNLKSTQSQLIQSEKLASLGELTAGIAHEIQNPLNFVNNFSEMSVELANELKEEAQKPEIDKELIIDLANDLSANQAKINHHGKRASSIVSGMLEHSKASTGEYEMTNINKLANEALHLVYHGMSSKQTNGSMPRFMAEHEFIADESLPLINVVPQDIGRVLRNLINNAFYACAERSAMMGVSNQKVQVSTHYIDNHLVIKVIDNGTGMSEATKAKIFQPFFTTKPTGEGTGLGLSLAYDIVTKGHGGTLEVQSSEGIGSEFIISLPFKTIGA